MGRIQAEYIWMDGHKPTAKLRSKTRIINRKIKSIRSQLFTFFGRRYLEQINKNKEKLIK